MPEPQIPAHFKRLWTRTLGCRFHLKKIADLISYQSLSQLQEHKKTTVSSCMQLGPFHPFHVDNLSQIRDIFGWEQELIGTCGIFLECAFVYANRPGNAVLTIYSSHFTHRINTHLLEYQMHPEFSECLHVRTSRTFLLYSYFLITCTFCTSLSTALLATLSDMLLLLPFLLFI